VQVANGEAYSHQEAGILLPRRKRNNQAHRRTQAAIASVHSASMVEHDKEVDTACDRPGSN
jgi:hypothetical protein